MILEGLTVPLITPLNEDESLDEVSLRRVIDLSIEGGARAIFILGTAGEFAALSRQTKDRLARAAKELIDRRVDFLIGISHAGTRGTIEEGKRMEKVGADAFVVMAPFYFSYSQKEVERHFLTIAHSLNTPLVMYNFPGMVKNAIEPETVARLVHESQIVGIKNTHGDMDAAEQILSTKKARPGSFSFSQGDLPTCGECLRKGAEGVTLGIASLVPSLCARLCEAASAGDAETVDTIVGQLVDLSSVDHSKSWVAGLKMQASLLGLCKPFVSAPFEMPDEADTRMLRQKLLELNLLQE
jgi:4-hydroxy-tetrahydrodipicolinate synthase